MEFGSLLLPLGIIPAIFAIYIFADKKYEGKFEEKKMLFSFIIGMALGIFIYLLEMPAVSQNTGKNLYLGNIMILSAIFSLIEQISKLAVLNSHFFRGEGSPIYGACMGAAFSSPFASIFIGKIEIKGYGIIILLTPIVLIFLTAYSTILTGITVKKRRVSYVLYAIIYSYTYWVFLFFLFYFKYTSSSIPFFIILFGISIISIYHAYKKLLPYTMLERKELKKFL